MQYEILQMSSYDCGFVVLKVMLASLNHDRNYLLMPELKGKKYSLLDLKNIAKEHQLDLEGYKIDELDTLSTFTFPIICQIKKDKSEHFVLLNKIKNNKYYIFDPNVGELILSFDEFFEAFNHNILAISEHKKEKYIVKKEKININLLCSLIFNSMSSIMFFISLIFINDYLLFFLSVILGIIFLFLQKKANQRFVSETNSIYNLNYENLVDISNYQKQIIRHVTNIPSKIVLFFTIIMMLNNSYDYGYLSVFFVIALIVIYKFLQFEFKHEANKIEYLEQCKFELSKVSKLANKYANKMSLILIMFSISIAVFVFYMMQTNDLVGIDFFIMQFSLMFGSVIFSKDILSLDDTFKETTRKQLVVSAYKEKNDSVDK